MQSKSNPQTSASRSRWLSLRSILVIPFVLQVSAAVGLIGYLSVRNGQQAVNDLASQLRGEVSDRIHQHLDSYLNTGRNLAEINGGAMDMGLLDPDNPQQIGQFFWKQLQLYNVGYISLCLKTGDFAAAGRYFQDGRITVEEVSKKRNGNQHSYVYNTDKQGNRTNLAVDTGPYVAMQEAWCEQPMKVGKSMWTLYQWQSPPYTLSVSANRPVYDKNKNLIGVIGVDQRLTQISDFLQQLKVSPSGKTFILERNGLLIASSNKEQPFTLVNGKAKRLQGSDSKDPLIEATAKHLTERFNNLSNIKDNQSLEFQLNDQRHFVQVAPWRDEWGLDWLVVVAVPEADFMERINANTRTTILLCLGALGLATALGLYTSRWITRPILRLSRASEAIAGGELTQSVAASSVGELNILARSFNGMAEQLRESFTALEQRVEERTVELKIAKNEAESAKVLADVANDAKSEFLASMSHELRTPLNGILGYAQILQRSEPLTDKGRKGIDIIYQCGSHLLTLINDVLDLSKIEARKMDLVENALHFPAFLQSVAEICRIRAEQKNIVFEFEPDSQLPIGVYADEKRLRQVLINLLGNAIKFTEKGGVTLAVHSLEDHKIRFEIRDTGVGMTPDQLEKIFLPFEQVGDTKKQSEGTGLGLAISQKIVLLMGSALEVSSQIGAGSTFGFEVTLPEAEHWVTESRVVSQGTIEGYQGNRRKILVVDDRWENRSVVVNLLEPIGFQLIEASNGHEGIEQALMTQPDLIITDLAMPILNGFGLIQKLRSLSQFQDTILLVSSASVFESDQYKSLNAGANAFLPKPVQTDTLLNLLQQYLKLEWIYQEIDNSKNAEIESPISTEIIAPSQVILKQLCELHEEGEIDLIIEVAQQLQ
ncbi:hybrid sensor histidine kinase/response regulator [Phormidesmis priestleyi]|uniref:hybrid sensor histidine kinase/response regulator n=1 Tax=Phormidesmis priestleyi TaxID=268141 RepID=UPI000B182855|nr:hybrid sensor histidine kinase/response regulator [Phormidesmis priestleyi]